ncbi:hypothetical protein BpHYR1_016810 [Brachionus plicatilis]|uniref:Uncharacterized protein n=1 Tax=Brachionus plicatilis TaxID=10195 RepID=A0A3M7PWU4_BRAPC|nr:hypothetical protein BpHYR1_016810 [Brachionus plicatilis]
MKPMMAKPMAVAKAIFLNSLRSGLVHFLTRRVYVFITFFEQFNIVSNSAKVNDSKNSKKDKNDPIPQENYLFLTKWRSFKFKQKLKKFNFEKE